MPICAHLTLPTSARYPLDPSLITNLPDISDIRASGDNDASSFVAYNSLTTLGYGDTEGSPLIVEERLTEEQRPDQLILTRIWWGWGLGVEPDEMGGFGGVARTSSDCCVVCDGDIAIAAVRCHDG